MKKELIYMIYVLTIFGFIIFIGTYYFSNDHKKKSYRLTTLFEKKISNYNNDLMILDGDTENIIEYIENNLNKNKKKYYFWDLLFKNEK